MVNVFIQDVEDELWEKVKGLSPKICTTREIFNQMCEGVLNGKIRIKSRFETEGRK